MTERRIKPSFSFQRTINAHKEGHKLIIRGEDKVIKLTYGSNITGDIYTTLYQDNEPLYITSSTRTTLTEQKQIFDGLHQ